MYDNFKACEKMVSICPRDWENSCYIWLQLLSKEQQKLLVRHATINAVLQRSTHYRFCFVFAKAWQ